MISVSNDMAIGFWDLIEDTQETIQKAHEGSIYCCAWFMDCNRFATSSADKTVKIWSFDEKKCLYTLKISEKPTIEDMQNGVCVCDSKVVSVSLNGNLNIWNMGGLDDGKMPDEVIINHNSNVQHIFREENSDFFYTLSQSGTILKHCADGSTRGWRFNQ